jgi:hypothetical protein
MKNWKTPLIITAIVGVMLYLAGAFVAASFDISTWFEPVRWIITGIWVIVFMVVGGVYIEENQ